MSTVRNENASEEPLNIYTGEPWRPMPLWLYRFGIGFAVLTGIFVLVAMAIEPSP